MCALAIRDGILPVNANYANPDPDCELYLVVGEARKRDVRVALSNSFVFGGSNSCLAFRNPDHERPPEARSARLPPGGNAPLGRPGGRDGGRR